MFQFVLISCIVAAVCGSPQLFRPRLDGRIVGGVPVDIKDHPHQISLLSYGRHICGGSIISQKYVVTAAHCTYGASPSGLSIRAGTSKVNSGGIVIKVKKIHQNPDFDYGTIDYDISVLELEESVTYSKDVQAISLPKLNQDVPAGSEAVCTGWGALSSGGGSPSQLQGVKVPIVSLKECRDAYGKSAITDRMICAGYPQGGKDACQGDSGGPLVVDNKLVGIVSWGYGCAQAGYPGVYSNVPTLRGYITQVAEV